MTKDTDDNKAPVEEAVIMVTIPAQESPQDTSNWDDREFSSPSGERKMVPYGPKRERNKYPVHYPPKGYKAEEPQKEGESEA